MGNDSKKVGSMGSVGRVGDIELAPPNFGLGDGDVVFVDILRQKLDVELDTPKKSARIKAQTTFQQWDRGFPIIDLVPGVTTVRIDGVSVDPQHYVEIRDPDKQSYLRVIKKELPPGEHTLELEYALDDYFKFDKEGVEFDVALSDLTERRYIERYFPSNYQYDTYPVEMNMVINGATTDHVLIANGDADRVEKNRFQVRFPDFYNAASFYFALFPQGRRTVLRSQYQQQSGPPLAVTVFGASKASVLEVGRERLLTAALEHEKDYGPFCHKQKIMHYEGEGGMEYSGAMRTSQKAIDHEHHHSYFARCVQAADGNSGWMDEALARWHDRGYPRANKFGQTTQTMALASFSPYRRSTTDDAYEYGADLMAELDFVFAESGGLRPILREWYQLKQKKIVTTKMFEDFLVERAPKKYDLRDWFRRKVYGSVDVS